MIITLVKVKLTRVNLKHAMAIMIWCNHRWLLKLREALRSLPRHGRSWPHMDSRYTRTHGTSSSPSSTPVERNSSSGWLYRPWVLIVVELFMDYVIHSIIAILIYWIDHSSVRTIIILIEKKAGTKAEVTTSFNIVRHSGIHNGMAHVRIVTFNVLAPPYHHLSFDQRNHDSLLNTSLLQLRRWRWWWRSCPSSCCGMLQARAKLLAWRLSRPDRKRCML